MRAFAIPAVLGAAMLWFGAAAAGAQELKVGDPAPNFELQSTQGKSYKLEDFKGKQAVVLAWYPKAKTSGCTMECKSLTQKGDLIRQYDVTYFMASVDPLADNESFAKEQNADFPLLSDPTKEVAKKYGVLRTDFPVANRWTFYIGKDGKIQAIDKEVSGRVQTAAEDIAAKLGELGVDKKK